jgi:predicted transcriptional regulator/transcriptional regulator with XRE-family HTH domain
MANERPVFMGPRLRRLRRDLGLTQANMASDLDISPSYVALLERNQRPMTADLLLRLARTYTLDMADLAGEDREALSARVQAILKDPLFADLDLPPLEATDIATNFPGMTEAFQRLYTAYQEEQLALADKAVEPVLAGDSASGDATDPVAEARRFLSARRNNFPTLDDAGERLAKAVSEAGGLVPYFKSRHKLRVRRLPSDVLVGSVRRLDRHREEVLLDETLDSASQSFQLALQLAYLELRKDVNAVLDDGHFASVSAERLTRRALAGYAAAAILMPYTAFARALESRRYDIEAVARQFGASFEQTAHRLTTMQRPGQECIPFFFIRVDAAGNVSKRLDGAGFPFARHGGGCPLWSVHQVFRTPREIITQWLELPDGQRYFSIARTVTAGGGGYGHARVERAIALGCAADQAHRLIYTQGLPDMHEVKATPIGVTCRLCHRAQCNARSAPPIGRQILSDDIRRASAPFGFSDD